jgi:hypothetical protein
LIARYGISTPLCKTQEEARKAIQWLLLKDKADLPNDRRSFFVCPECGDLVCGAVTAIVVKEGDTVSWRNFGHQNNYEDAILPGQLQKRGASYV